ncbi:hypothetical protein ACQUSR_19265 [Streptomyces sp. P1-3]|uniref:hypothetical protein n=1 Tax=Streptomyces sp. P1-3 TaxID=3421658 RepID=UPI003D36BAB7
MGDKLGISPATLRGCGGAASSITDSETEFSKSITKAIKDTGDAAGTLTSWAFGTALQSCHDDWGKALKAMKTRLAKSGDLLRETANGHEWNDQKIYDTFTGVREQ